MSAGTVTWVLNGDNKYEISSKEHLLQVMNKGTLYTDAGTAPAAASYWAVPYIQTVDIDFENDATNVHPIGTASSTYTKIYDGGGHRISNWSFHTGTVSLDFAGLFGYVQGSVRNLVLDGVWSLTGPFRYGGFLAGYCYSLANIDANFSDGTIMSGGKVDAWIGGLFGHGVGGDEAVMSGVTLRGVLEMDVMARNIGGIGGVVPFGTLRIVRNLARFKGRGVASSNGAADAGGIVGYRQGGVGMSQVVNGMRGNISGANAGGFVGTYTWRLAWEVTASHPTALLNCMTGDITATTGAAGGIFGRAYAKSGKVCSMTQIAVYMSGNISSGTAGRSGGLFGQSLRDANTLSSISASNSIVAMRGSVDDPVVGLADYASPTMEAKVVPDFGLTFATNAYATASALTLTGYSTHPDLPETLPYFETGGTDAVGNAHASEFVFANVGAIHPSYTHATVHRTDMTGPFAVEYDGIPGTIEYLSFSNVNASNGGGVVYTTGLYAILSTNAAGVLDIVSGAVLFGTSPNALELTPGPINIGVAIAPVSGAVGLKVTYQGPTGSQVTAASGILAGPVNIRSLQPEVAYTVRLYVDSGAGYVLQETHTVSTLPDSSANYRSEDFKIGGKISLSGMDEASRARLSAVMNDLFVTGEKVGLTFGRRSVDAEFVNTGDTVETDASALFLPFDPSSGSSQTVDLQLSNDSVVSVVYDPATNSIEVDGTVYSVGDYIVLDNKKVEIVDV